MPRQAHLLSDQNLRRMGYQLLSFLYAEYEWQDLRRDDDPDVLDEMLASSENDISELLVSLAALARANDDAQQTLEGAAQSFPEGVGVLRARGNEDPLTPREACNKIIHAQGIEWQFEYSSENPLYEKYYQRMELTVRKNFKNPRMLIRGHNRGTVWEATVDIVPFVVAVSNYDVSQWAFR